MRRYGGADLPDRQTARHDRGNARRVLWQLEAVNDTTLKGKPRVEKVDGHYCVRLGGNPLGDSF